MTSDLVLLLCVCRFVQMAPQYFFYNLPPSECKELLQYILDTAMAECEKSKQTMQPAITEMSNGPESQSYDRCVIQ